MVHKAFQILGERVIVNDKSGRKKEGIFWESENFQTNAEGASRPALDFIEPIYSPNPTIEELAKGIRPRERVIPDNPILSLNMGVDQLKLRYSRRRGGIHTFDGELEYVQGVFFNDGNYEVYDKYKEPLRKAGFKIR